MKFRYRVFAVGILCVLLLVALIAWSVLPNGVVVNKSALLESFSALRLPFLEVSTTGYSNDKFDVDTTYVPIAVGVKNQFITLEESSVDIRTVDILDAINKATVKKPHNGSVTSTMPPSVEMMAKGLPLKVIVVPHSHSDPGWHKTVDGYFDDQTKQTLDNMVDKLQQYPNMTFVWAESVFLSMWWKDLEKEKQQIVRQLVRRGQLEIVCGSWVVPDEANTHYFSLVDQMIEGHLWLKSNLQVTPRNSWSLDPFGYSAVVPYLYKRAGFDNSVILRVHAGIKDYLQKQRALEFMWRPVWNRRNDTEIMTLMMPYMLYNIKHSCGPDSNVCLQFDFRKIRGEVSESRAQIVHPGNVDRLAKLLLGQYQRKANLFRHNVVLIPLGDDFRYDHSIEWDQQFRNYMLLFNYMNAMPEWNVHARFGTVQDYFQEVKAAMVKLHNVGHGSFPSLSGDFFPYTDHSDEFWTGYFSTRPFAKSLSRDLEIYLRSAEILHSLAVAKSAKKHVYESNINYQKLVTARQNLALFQHHDGITGTSRVWVAEDYASRLANGLFLTRGVIGSASGFLLRKDSPRLTSTFKVLEPLSARMLSPNQHVIYVRSGGIRVHVFNNVANHRHELVHFVINHQQVIVTDHAGQPVLSQVGPTSEKLVDPLDPVNMLSFIADLPPLGMAVYDIYVASNCTVGCSESAKVSVHMTTRSLRKEHITINNKLIQAVFSMQSGLLESFTVKNLNHTVNIDLNFLLYTSRHSGAYLFAPSGPAEALGNKRKAVVHFIEGRLFSEIRLIHPSITHIARLVNCEGSLAAVIELMNIVDMTELDDKELIMRVDTSVHNGNIFHTDQNGFQTAKRKRFSNFLREANYYPATSTVFLEDENSRLSIIMSQPFGVTSQKEGSLEVMLDRRLLYDDNRGLGEGVLDNKPVFSHFFLLLEKSVPQMVANHNFLSLPTLLGHVVTHHLRNQPVILLSTPENNGLSNFSPMFMPFSCDTVLVNFRTVTNNSKSAALIMHRIGYSSMYDFGHSNQLLECQSSFSSLIPAQIFKEVHIHKFIEMTLSLLYKIKNRDPYEHLVLDEMQLYTFKLVFKQYL